MFGPFAILTINKNICCDKSCQSINSVGVKHSFQIGIYLGSPPSLQHLTCATKNPEKTAFEFVKTQLRNY